MLFGCAGADDLAEIAALINQAYGGTGDEQGWTHEGGLIAGDRTRPEWLAKDLAETPGAFILTLREAAGAPLRASLWLEPKTEDIWYLGLVAVRPGGQAQGTGRRLLEEAERIAAEAGAKRMRLTVINLRDTLRAWYERRGYEATGELVPFPHLEGRERRDDLVLVAMEKPLA